MNDPPEKTALLSAENLLSPVGMTLPNHGRKISSCSFRPSVELQKMTPCLVELFLHVGIGGFRVELGFHAGEERALLLGNAETLEGFQNVGGHVVPRALRLLAVG